MAKTIFSRWDHCYHLHCSISMTRRPKNISLGGLLRFSAPFACMCLFWLEAAYFHYGLSGRGLLIVRGSGQNGVFWGRGLYQSVNSSSEVCGVAPLFNQGGRWADEMWGGEGEIEKESIIMMNWFIWGWKRCGQIEGWWDNSSAVIRMCGNLDANRNVLLVISDRKPQESTEACVVL